MVGRSIYQIGQRSGQHPVSNNLKLLVMGGLIRSMVERYGPLLCNVSGPRARLGKHEDLRASPKMAKRLEEILLSRA
jgi:hypothetical protein